MASGPAAGLVFRAFAAAGRAALQDMILCRKSCLNMRIGPRRGAMANGAGRCAAMWWKPRLLKSARRRVNDLADLCFPSQDAPSNQRGDRDMKDFRIAMAAGIAIAGLTALAAPAHAQSYPTQTVRIVIPFPPGGSTDLVSRMIAAYLSTAWKQSVIVENKPGGNGMLGPTFVAKAKPDGYTILLAAPSLATAPATMKVMPIDPQKDLDAISQTVESPYVVSVNAKVPVKTLQELIDYAKKNPGKLNYGSFAVGSRLTSERFARIAGVKLNHVGYRGEALMMAATASGEVEVGLATPVTMMEYYSRGAIRILAVSSSERLPALKDIPTTKEAGLGEFDTTVWFGLFAPAGTPMDIRRKIAAGVAEWAKTADAIKKLEGVGFRPKASTPEQLAEHLRLETQRAVDIGKAIGIEKM